MPFIVSIDAVVGSEDSNYVNKEVKMETTKTDAEISTDSICGGNDRIAAEAKAASIEDEQMQWSNGDTGRDCRGRSSPAMPGMDVSLGTERCW